MVPCQPFVSARADDGIIGSPGCMVDAAGRASPGVATPRRGLRIQPLIRRAGRGVAVRFVSGHWESTRVCVVSAAVAPSRSPRASYSVATLGIARLPLPHPAHDAPVPGFPGSAFFSRHRRLLTYFRLLCSHPARCGGAPCGESPR